MYMNFEVKQFRDDILVILVFPMALRLATLQLMSLNPWLQ